MDIVVYATPDRQFCLVFSPSWKTVLKYSTCFRNMSNLKFKISNDGEITSFGRSFWWWITSIPETMCNFFLKFEFIQLLLATGSLLLFHPTMANTSVLFRTYLFNFKICFSRVNVMSYTKKSRECGMDCLVCLGDFTESS